jgi:hypothetical protein
MASQEYKGNQDVDSWLRSLCPLDCMEGSRKNEQWTVFYVLEFQVTSYYSYSKIRYNETFGIYR